MKEFPATPPLDEAPDALTESGHLWLLERIDGAPFRFQVEQSGLIRFGDESRVFHPEEIPLPYQHAVRHVREHLDREALRSAVDDVESVVFFGVATHQHTIDYDWERLPSFLGTDVWTGDDERYLTFDAVENALERLGLESVNTFERELPARDFQPGSYAIPGSAWYDGPAAGVVVRNKGGERGELRNPDIEAVDGGAEVTVDDIVADVATDERFEAVERRLQQRNEAVTVEALTERAFEAAVRTHHRDIYRGAANVEVADVRSAIEERVRAYLGYT